MEFGRPLTDLGLVTTRSNITKLGKLTNFYMIFLVMGFISQLVPRDLIGQFCGPYFTVRPAKFELDFN